MTSFRFQAENPHFIYFLRGHQGLRLREEVELAHEVKIQVLPSAEEVQFCGKDFTAASDAMRDLKEGWYEDDFAKARELVDLLEDSPHSTRFSVPVKSVSGLIGHFGKRVTAMEERSGASIKIDCEGHVAVFGGEEACRRAREEVEDWVRQEGGERTLLSAHSSPASAGDAPESGEAGAVLSFLVPSRGAALIIGRRGKNVAEFERIYECGIDLRTAEETKEGMVPVVLRAAGPEEAREAVQGILAFLDRYFPTRDWPQQVETHNAAAWKKKKEAGSQPGVSRLTFNVPESSAPRLIGTRGSNKKRLEESTNCVLILRTEERRHGTFPVDVIGRSGEECEEAKQRIQTFLFERRGSPAAGSTPARIPAAGVARARRALLPTPPSPGKDGRDAENGIGGRKKPPPSLYARDLTTDTTSYSDTSSVPTEQHMDFAAGLQNRSLDVSAPEFFPSFSTRPVEGLLFPGSPTPEPLLPQLPFHASLPAFLAPPARASPPHAEAERAVGRELEAAFLEQLALSTVSEEERSPTVPPSPDADTPVAGSK